MGKISQRELDYIKQTITPEQLIDLVSLKSRINQRKRKLGINESCSERGGLDCSGFMEFIENLDEHDKNLFNGVFGSFYSDESGSSVQREIYNMFHEFLSKADAIVAMQSE